MDISQVANSNISTTQSVSTKQTYNQENNEKIVEIKPSVARNAKSEHHGPMINTDKKDFYNEEDSDYSEDDNDYSDESYELDEAETAQEAFEAKYYHSRRTTSSPTKSSFINNKISLKKVNTLLANQNIMVVNKSQLSETINNQKAAEQQQQQQQQSSSSQPPSNNIDLTILYSNSNSSLATSNSDDKVTEAEKSEPKEGSKNRRSSKKYENTQKPSEYVMEDNDGYIKSKKSKSRRRSDASSSNPNSFNSSMEKLNVTSSSTQPSDANTSSPSNKSAIQITVNNKKQIQIHCGPNSSPIKIDDKNLAVIINPSSVQESDIQELIGSPSKSRCKNNKPSIPVISSSPYTKNHNKNNKNNQNNNISGSYNNSRPGSPQKLSANTHELMASPIKVRKDSDKKGMLASSPLFVSSNPPPLISPKSFGKNKFGGGGGSSQLTQDAINFKYSLLDEYNMKKSASPTNENKKGINRFLKDESEYNKEEEPQLSKKERRAAKKLAKNKKLNEELIAKNSTRQTYVVNNSDDPVYLSIFGGQCDPESEVDKSTSKKSKHKGKKQQAIEEEEEENIIEENSSKKKNNKKGRKAKNMEEDGEEEELDSPSKKKNNKKSQRATKQVEEEEEEQPTNVPKKKQNKKKNIKNGNVDDNNEDDNVQSRKHTRKNKHQELEFNIDDVDEDDLFGITGKPSSIKNKKSNKASKK